MVDSNQQDSESVFPDSSLSPDPLKEFEQVPPAVAEVQEAQEPPAVTQEAARVPQEPVQEPAQPQEQSPYSPRPAALPQTPQVQPSQGASYSSYPQYSPQPQPQTPQYPHYSQPQTPYPQQQSPYSPQSQTGTPQHYAAPYSGVSSQQNYYQQAAPRPQQAQPTQQTYQTQQAQQAYHAQQAQQTQQAYQAQQAQQAQQTYQTQQTQQAQQTQRSLHAKPQKRQGASKGMAFLMGIIGVLIGAALTGGILFLVTDGFSPVSVANTPQSPSYNGTNVTINPPAEDASLPVAVAEKTLPSVVNIDVYTTSRGGFYDDSDSRGGSNLQEYGLGSGVVISEDGYILTNYHVVEGGTEYLVRFSQEEQYRATVVGEDPTSDLAVLKVDAKGLLPIEIGDSSKVVVGEWVMALGSPFGLEKSVSTGIVSALFRSTTMRSTSGTNVYANMIQTDAAINPGNSGGALVNAEGKLIGINTLINSSSGSSSGVGFAIPSNYAMNIAQQIMDGKEVEHAFLGVQSRTIDAGNASSFNSKVTAGAYIEQVVPGSPAANAGLKEGDIVTRLDDSAISSAAELVINVRAHFVGDTVTLGIVRDGKQMTVEVTLGSDNS
ncbi:MAG: trypsin-like peptidase domain-containing protein [Coriobacteriales bacterium]|jgi:putative serine protease PepD|nr:trypsin-like peptidase domain-containing protein [Coriobacteriales bacterium]